MSALKNSWEGRTWVIPNLNLEVRDRPSWFVQGRCSPWAASISSDCTSSLWVHGHGNALLIHRSWCFVLFSLYRLVFAVSGPRGLTLRVRSLMAPTTWLTRAYLWLECGRKTENSKEVTLVVTWKSVLSCFYLDHNIAKMSGRSWLGK